MIKGKSLVELAEEIERQAQAKKDYLVGTNVVRAVHDRVAPGGLELHLPEHGHFQINDYAHGQISSRLNIPKNIMTV